MQEFLSLVPKHKGTAKLCAQVKKQMAALRREIEEKKRRKVGRSGPRFFIEKEGDSREKSPFRRCPFNYFKFFMNSIFLFSFLT